MDKLGRYYTKDIFSCLLVRNIRQKDPKTIIDIGVGGGALIKAAYKRWSTKATYYGIDIDKAILSKLGNSFPELKLIKSNGLSLKLQNKICITSGTIDVAICNPPYLKVTNKKNHKNILESGILTRSVFLNTITSDILFLAQNLQLLRIGGELGIILPDSLITGHNFKLLREDLIMNHKIKSIIQIPDKVFLKTEARTHILLIEKGGITDLDVPLYHADKFGYCEEKISVKRECLINRMDFSYHNWKETEKPTNAINLSSIVIDIKRGSFSNNKLKTLNQPFYHTTNFTSGKAFNTEKNLDTAFKNKTFAEPGDILLARVGNRCIGKICLVQDGEFLISDCVYRIRLPKEFIEVVYNNLKSEYGQNWMKNNAHGVCARLISKRDLENFPVHIN